MRRSLSVFIFLILSFFSTSSIRASEDFETSYQVSYRLQTDEKVATSQRITLINKLPDVYPTEYVLQMEGVTIEDIKASDGGGDIIPEIEKKDNWLKIKLKFNEVIIGQGKQLNFSVSYRLLNILSKNGEVWEVNLPRMPALENLQNESLVLAVPKIFGPLVFITSSYYQSSSDTDWRYYTFNQGGLGSLGISAAFGQFQSFDFSLSYHLQNPNSYRGKIEIAFPPDTSYQHVYLTEVYPKPENVVTDADGNWLALYYLGSGEALDIRLVGSAKVFAEPWEEYPKFDAEILERDLLAKKYWEVNEPKINALAAELKQVDKIYRFVVDHLYYDYNQIDNETVRKGALFALENPKASICMEFTDLFVALCRAAGIPARELNGYAYTTNSRLKPLNLISDVLHSWPEYWDKEKGVWIPVDPTWEKTTGGRNYFSRSDLNHFVFAIHGSDSESPLPAGSYKSNSETAKDIEVKIGRYQPYQEKELDIKFVLVKDSPQDKPFPKVVIRNPGPVALYQLVLKFASKDVEIQKVFDRQKTIKVIPPFGKIEITIPIVKPKIYNFGPASLSLTVKGKEYTFPFRIETLLWPQLIFSTSGICLGILWAFLLVATARWILKKFHR
ncbi:MAG TPA: transglutaminase-like domain-containing protein [Candidatus Bathyarchaeia archaeon]|nr:transglutaminase-like domain-containing protein [Candidatus Bathyarchaeia archaeon]